MDFPITVDKISYDKNPSIIPRSFSGGRCGDLVAIRPCAAECEGRTYLGVLLGEIEISLWTQFDSKAGELTINRHRNPAIFVPGLRKIVFGAESWWHRIKDAQELRQITDADIDGVWYVQLFKEAAAIEAEESRKEATP